MDDKLKEYKELMKKEYFVGYKQGQTDYKQKVVEVLRERFKEIKKWKPETAYGNSAKQYMLCEYEIIATELGIKESELEKEVKS